MNRRALPLLIDALPLYASRAQLVGAITTVPAEQKYANAMFDWRDFPRPSALLGGLYFVPAVVDYITEYESRQPSADKAAPSTREKVECDTTSRRRASRGGREEGPLKFRTG